MKIKRERAQKVLIYCRESRDEGCENYERIETQRDILIRFCKKQGFTNIVDIIMDDDVSGTGFKRYDKIIDRIMNNGIDIIVFKDSSRLGRNLRESLNFMALLEEYHVKVIFESEEYNEDFFPLLAWFNEQRAKEDSKKIRHVLKHKMETGELLVKPTYGYDKVGNQLVVNDETANIVKRIFDMYLNGFSSPQIATILNNENIPTPSQIRGSKNKPNIWVTLTVWRIIQNPIYKGTMVYGKKEKLNFKSKAVIRKEESEWIVIENHHKPIISDEQFDKVQRMRSRNKITKRKVNSELPFSGLLKCGRCSCNMIIKRRAQRNTNYVCGKNNKEGAVKSSVGKNCGCLTHTLREAYLYEMVVEYILKILKENKNDVIGILENKSDNKMTFSMVILNLEKQIANVDVIIEQIYEDRLHGNISYNLFEKKYNEYIEKRERYIQKRDEYQQLLYKESAENDEKWKDDCFLSQRVTNKAITKNLLRRIFESIIYFLPLEIKEEDKTVFNLTNSDFEQIYNEGGIVFVENF